jgi:hypothetical protein
VLFQVHRAAVMRECHHGENPTRVIAGQIPACGPIASVGDPEVNWRLADVLFAQGKLDDAEIQMEVARTGFEFLLGRHLLAFADHGAEFYAGSGNDCHRALELARVNAANRPTARALEQAHEIAIAAGDVAAASEFHSAIKALGHACDRREVDQAAYKETSA